MTHYLYRCYDAQGRLIYIGCTQNPRKRMRVHRVHKATASVLLQCYMVRWEVDPKVYPDRWTAREAEAEAIWEERPLFNQQESRTPMWLHRRNLYCYIRDNEPLVRTARLDEFVASVERLITCDDGPLTPAERKARSLIEMSGRSA